MAAQKRKTAWRELPQWRRVVAMMPCAHCGLEGRTQAAHVRHRGSGGMGLKPADCHIIPLCVECHHAQHQGNQPDSPTCCRLLQGLLMMLWGPAAAAAVRGHGQERMLCSTIGGEVEVVRKAVLQTPTWKWMKRLRAAVQEVSSG